MDLSKIGRFLAELRRGRGLTQAELGEKLGVTNKTVSRWETGNYLPPVEMLEALSRFYGLTINELLSGRTLDAGEYREARVKHRQDPADKRLRPEGQADILQKEVAEGAHLHVCYMYSRVGRSARFAVAPGRRGLAVRHGRRSARGAIPCGAAQPNGGIRREPYFWRPLGRIRGRRCKRARLTPALSVVRSDTGEKP